MECTLHGYTEKADAMSRTRTRYFLNACTALFMAMPAMAATKGQADLTELSIEQLLDIEVYSASKFAQKITGAPAAVSIVTAADIKGYGYRYRYSYRTLADILRCIQATRVDPPVYFRRGVQTCVKWIPT